MQLHTYLNYGGNCEQALRFYEQHLGGKIVMMMKFSDQPEAAARRQYAAGDEKRRRAPRAHHHWRHHAHGQRRPAGPRSADAQRLSFPGSGQRRRGRIDKLLAEGGEIFMPMQETFFAFRFSMLRDRFGTSWMIIHERLMHPRA
jgi:PhnB protein